MEEILKRVLELLDEDILNKKSRMIEFLIRKDDKYRDMELEITTEIYNLLIYRQIFEYNEEKPWRFVRDFDKVLELMDYHKFSERDKFNVIIYLIDKNNNANYLNGAKHAILLSNLKNIPMKNGVKEKLIQWSLDGTINEKMNQLLDLIDDDGYFTGKSDTLTYAEIKVMKEIYIYLPQLTETSSYIERQIGAHEIIKKCYLDKIDSYDEEDVIQTVKAFLNLDVPDNSCKAFQRIMEKDMEKRLNVVVPKENITQILKPVKKTNVISKKEYRQLLSKLRKCFNIEAKTVTHVLSMEEIVECASIMIQLGIDENEIKSYLRIMNKNQESNLFTWYLNNYEKLEFYCNDDYKKYLENLDAYFKEIFICSDEDYILLKDIMQVEIDEVKQIIPKTYEYELTMARKRTK